MLAAPGGLADLVPLTGAIDELLPAAELEPVAWTGAPSDVAIDLTAAAWPATGCSRRLGRGG